MASETPNPSAPPPAPSLAPAPAPSAVPREAVEHQDQSIKVRKSQLFEPKAAVANGAVIRPFEDYLKSAPPAPMTPGVKAALWTAGVLVVLLFVASLVLARRPRPTPPRRTQLPPTASAACLA